MTAAHIFGLIVWTVVLLLSAAGLWINPRSTSDLVSLLVSILVIAFLLVHGLS